MINRGEGRFLNGGGIGSFRFVAWRNRAKRREGVKNRGRRWIRVINPLLPPPPPFPSVRVGGDD